ncbi:UvrD-helicase domain-containing protein [Nocardioides sp. Bht2]|uniref:UvrD-helicase domain-containing protein n=1 Tax=Nocardioides sp. Bht2 TaxID=3392297 RepID=UPI0039B6AF7B
MSPDLAPFAITDPLPTGTTLLEASAGTGKTWTIGALVARFVAEGVATLEEMLVVTFGRAASQELRERVRSQLVELEAALGAPETVPGGNEVVDLLIGVDDDERLRRRRRVREALAGFDAATIATTHQFCQLVLRSLGVAGDTDADATLVDDLDDLVVEVVDDLYLRGFARSDEGPAFSRRTALAIGRAAMGDPQARLQPTDDDPAGGPGRRVAFAGLVRQEVERRKRKLGVLGYDDLLSQLADALVHPDAPARVRMRQRWKVVLVDEFQDTDPVQWQVLDRAFTGHATMVFIGDPKQAIYAFRGGDVVTYLDAAETAGDRRTLGTNWRSDPPLLDRLNTVLDAAALGDPRIVARHVDAAHTGSRLIGAPEPEPFTVRVLNRSDFGSKGRRKVAIGRIRPAVAADCAHQIKALLASDATFDGRPIRPGDVAVLAHTGKQLQLVYDALSELGVPAVIAGGGSVFSTPAAREWLALLEALEQPHRAARARAAALTAFVGVDAVALDADPDLTDRLSQRFVGWAGLFAQRGVAAVLEASVVGGLYARVLGDTGGERRLTDLKHVGQALHQMVLTERLGLVALVQWLRRSIAEAATDTGSERTRRLDSDAAAVQLVTIHGSKGLQYPVVHLPFVADRWVPEPDIPRFHAPADHHRALDVGGPGGSGWHEALRLAKAEEAGESLRLLYVAMTRAQSQVVTWWFPSTNTPDSSLHRLLVGRGPGHAAVPDRHELPDNDDVMVYFEAWQARGGPTWRRVEPPAASPELVSEERSPLGVREFGRVVDTAWRRTSYSALSAAAQQAAVPSAGALRIGEVGSEPEETPKTDEPAGVDTSTSQNQRAQETADGADPLATLSPMATLPVGATFGSLVHGVLEHADPQAASWPDELRRVAAEQLLRWPVELDLDVLVDALVEVCASPLGSLAGDVSLAQIPLTERLRELEFEFPLAGGDHPTVTAPVLLGDLAPVLRRHLPTGDPLLPYADALADPALGTQSLKGYLTGSIDVVLRVDGRYLVVDYKTNWLGPMGEPLFADHYRPSALAEAMGHSDYPLQAVLYAVVLHRYLRWRLPDYDPDQHLGGVLYLYVRGMCGAATPRIDGEPTGVFAWRPPTALVLELSDLLDGGAR